MVIRVGILHIPAYDQTASDAIRELLQNALDHCFVQEENAFADQRNLIEEVLRSWADERELDLILTVGATLPAPGPSGREIAPDATQSVIERVLPGIAESMRAYAQEQSELALLDCSVSGIRGRTLIVNLPAGAASAHLFLEAVVDLVQPTIAHLNDDQAAPQLEHALSSTWEKEEPLIPDQAVDMALPTEEQQKLDPVEFQEFLQRKRTDFPPQA